MSTQFGSMEGPNRALAASVLAVVAILVATLWPMNPFPPNRVSWLQGTNGLKFEQTGLLVGSTPLQPPETNESDSYALELLLRPAVIKGSSTVLGFYNPTRSKQLLVRQSEDQLSATHDAKVKFDPAARIEFDVSHVFRPGVLTVVAISSGPNGTVVYVDGQARQVFPEFRISRSELSGEIILGSSPVAYQPWSGEIRGFAIYAKNLGVEDAVLHYKSWVDPRSNRPDRDAALAVYTFAEAAGTTARSKVASRPNLNIPRNFYVPHKILLQSPRQEFRPDWRYGLNLVSNIAGFVPLGLIVCAFFQSTAKPWKATLLTIIFSGMLSFTIEVLQYYIPKRGSGITDIITNTLGAALGATLIQLVGVRSALQQLKLFPAAKTPASK